MRAKPLTQKQQEQFKTLYLEGYSASRIFEKLGFKYRVTDYRDYTRSMMYYRKKLGLPKRGKGFNVKNRKSRIEFTQYHIPSVEDRRLARIEALKKSIRFYSEKVERWRKELALLEAEHLASNGGKTKIETQEIK